MASFFYADIKTDELQVHGHNPSIPAQIELLDANASNMVIIRAPISLTQPNVIITLPSNVATANSLMMNTLGNGELSFISPGGDISMDMNGSFTVNSLSNSSTVTSYSNLIMSVDKRLQFRDSNNYISSNSTGDMLIKSEYGNIFITATGEVVILSKSNGTVKIVNEGVNELGFIVEQPNTYINFGATTGSNGYGIRDNNGVLQIKNRVDAPFPIYEWSNMVARLDNLQDCNISGVSNNQVLVYNSAQSRWVNSNSVGQLGYYGSFYDTTTQLSAGTTSANPIKLNTTAEAYGVSIVGTSNIKVAHAGVYNIQFSAQLENTGSGTHPVDIWLTKNGINESNTNTKVTLVGNNSKNVAAWNYVLSLNANDYVTLYWASTTANNIQLTAEGASVSPTRPAVPSVIATITQITNIQDGTLRLGDLLNVNDTSKTSNSLIQYNSAQSQWQSVSNITLDTGNMLKLGSTANISAPVTGNLTLQGSNIDLIVPNGNEVHVHNNLRVTGTLFMDGNSTSNISAPTASNLDLKAGNVNITGTQLISCLGNVSIGQANTLQFGSTANISAPANGNLTLQNNNISLIANNEASISSNLRVTRNVFIGSGNTSNISAPTASNLDLKAGNVNIVSTSQIINQVAGQTIYSANYVGSNSIINMGSTSGESGIGFKNTSGGQIQVKPNSSASWTNLATHLSNLGDVTISTPANTNALIYNSGTSRWVNRAITYDDITGSATRITFTSDKINIGSNTGITSQGANTVAIGTNAGFTGQGSNSIAIGTNAGYSNLPSNAVVISGIGSVWATPASNAGFYVAPVRNDNTQTSTIKYNPSTYEVVYDNRKKDYIVVRVYGNLINYTVANQTRNLFTTAGASTAWTLVSSATSQQNNMSWSNTTGNISLNSSRLYKVDLNVSWWFSAITQGQWILSLVDSSANTVVTRMYQNANGDNVSLALTTFVTGQSNIYSTLQYTNTATTGDDTVPECSVTICAVEV